MSGDEDAKWDDEISIIQQSSAEIALRLETIHDSSIIRNMGIGDRRTHSALTSSRP